MNAELRSLAEQALHDAAGNWDRAKESLLVQILHTPDLYERQVVSLVREAVGAAVMYVGRHARQEAYAGSVRPLGKETPPTARLKQGQQLFAIDSLMECAMRGGHKVIGDATRGELQSDAAWYLQSSRSMRVTGRWLGLVAEKLPDDTVTVRQALTEKLLRQMRQAAEREAA